MAATRDQLSAVKYGPRSSPLATTWWPPRATNPAQLDRSRCPWWWQHRLSTLPFTFFAAVASCSRTAGKCFSTQRSRLNGATLHPPLPPGRVGRVTAVCSRRRFCCPLRPFLGWCVQGWVKTPVASSQTERREHGCRGVCRWAGRIPAFSNETVFFAPPSSICYPLLPSAAVEPFLARRLLGRFATRAWQRAAVTRCLAGEWEMRRGCGAKRAKGGRKGRCLGVGGSALIHVPRDSVSFG
jgi:hypothetical protein